MASPLLQSDFVDFHDDFPNFDDVDDLAELEIKRMVGYLAISFAIQ